MSLIQSAVISPCLWFDGEAEAAATHYTGIFPNSRIHRIARYPNVGQEGLLFCALNGGPGFKFNEAISLQILCDTQQQIDHYWHALGEGGGGQSVQCGWLKDRYGVSWQVAPRLLGQLALDPDPARAARAFGAMMKMVKIDIAEVERAAGAR
jgi:predicted 3-demethylubiquinone-9 3-methyltransferase (glyoxalase superfamily)